MRLLVLLLWCACCLSCGGGEVADGGACRSSDDCAAGFCDGNRCLTPAGDFDGDGVSNDLERTFGSNASAADTDSDGKLDAAEWGGLAAKPLDSDADGKPDVLESAVLDRDLDCLPDERDPRDLLADASAQELASLGCRPQGVCAGHAGLTTAACVEGVLLCNRTAIPGWHATELCDGLDDDCDGLTDELFSWQGILVGGTCDGWGACGVGRVECRGGAAQCSTAIGGSQEQASTEVCNGIDDDCDGDTDEGFALAGIPVGGPCDGVGGCGLGVVVCVAGGATCSSDAGGPEAAVSPEVCNGIDDDCDGLTDDGLGWQGLPLGASCVATGVCGAGAVICHAGVAVCSSVPGVPGSPASSESCNGLDDNCNGVTDEGISLAGSPLGSPCSGKGGCGPGVVTCSTTGTATCSTWADGSASQAKAEQCNGLDDDCDGVTDEGFHWQGKGLGAVCDGIGSCGAGVVECSAAGKVTCSSNPDGSQPQVGAEACNGVDDDCDGQTDEGVVAPDSLPCPAVGVCLSAAIVPICAAGQWQCTYPGATGWQASEVSCDGLDNDCDGQTDEGLPHQWLGPSTAGDGGPAPRRWPAVARGPTALLVAGGLVGAQGPVAEVLSAELWRLDLDTLAWKRLASHPLLRRQHSAAVYLPAGVGGVGARLWVLGGRDTDGQPAPAAEFDFLTGAVSPLDFKGSLAHRDDASAVLLKGEIWLLGGGAAQRIVAGGLVWAVAEAQPPSGTTSATSWGDSLVAVGDAPTGVWAAQWWPGNVGWQLLPSPSALTSTAGARLVAGSSLALLGGTGENGALQPSQVLAPKALSWQAEGASLAVRAAAAAVLGSGDWVATLGIDASGVPQSHTRVSQSGAWIVQDTAPPPAVGSRWLEIAGDLVRVGGAQLRAGSETADEGAWRLHAGQWQSMPLPGWATGRALAAAMVAADGQSVLVWGGTGKTPGSSVMFGAQVQAAVPGALKLDLGSGQWSNVAVSIAAQLPQLPADAPFAPIKPGQAFALGSGPTPGKVGLWHVQPAATSQMVWHDALGAGPPLRPGTALAWDDAHARLLLAQVDAGALRFWRWSIGQLQWTMWHSVPVAAPLRCAISGTGSDRLVWATGAPGTTAQVWRWTLDATPTATALSLPVADWAGTVEGTWLAGQSRVVVAGRLHADGSARAGLDQFVRACF